MNRFTYLAAFVATLVGIVLIGCDAGSHTHDVQATRTTDKQTSPEQAGDDVAVERAKLGPADRALVDAQEWCVIQSDERLGSMGPPTKLDIKGQPVFVCCKGCKKNAEADPDKTLAKVEELKAKAKAEKSLSQ